MLKNPDTTPSITATISHFLVYGKEDILLIKSQLYKIYKYINIEKLFRN